MAFLTIDDFSGSCECIAFSKVYEKVSDIVVEENVVMLKGRVESSGDSIKLHLDEIEDLSSVKEKLTDKFVLYLDTEKHTEETVRKLKVLLQKFPGDKKTFVIVTKNKKSLEKYILNNFKVSITEELLNEINNLLGENSYKFFA